MKLSNRKKHGANIELSMTSMIDVVFLLLIFFMTTTTFVQTERQLDPAIRVERASASQATTDLEPAIVEVIRSGERYVYRVGTRELADERALLELLKQFGNQSQGAFVRVADDAPFAMAAAAVQACKAANYIPVSYVPMESGQ